MNREHGVNAFRAYDAAFSYEGAFPNSFDFMHYWKSNSFALVSGILNVPVSQRRSRGAQELLVEAINWAGGVAEHTVDTGRELIISLQFLSALTVFTVFRGRLLLSDYPGLDLYQFMHEVIHVDNEVFDDWKVGEGFHLDRPTFELVEKASTGELRDPIYICTAAPADPHSARPTVGQRPI